MDYCKLVKDIISSLVTNPDDLKIELVEESNTKIVYVTANNLDTARLIGRGGNNANDIRECVSVASKLNNERVLVKFNSFDENK